MSPSKDLQLTYFSYQNSDDLDLPEKLINDAFDVPYK